jgi:hypothetical protein
MALNLTQEMVNKAASILTEWGNESAEHMRQLLRQRLKHKQGESNLAQSIQVENTAVTKDTVTFKFTLNDYYMFIDLGVKGLRNKSQTYTSKEYPSGFRFRTMSTPPSMINSLQNFIARKGIPVRKSKSQSSSEVIQDSFSMAKAMAEAIKKKGIDGTRFYSDTFDEANFKRLETRLQQGLGQDIEIKIVNDFKQGI